MSVSPVVENSNHFIEDLELLSNLLVVCKNPSQWAERDYSRTPHALIDIFRQY